MTLAQTLLKLWKLRTWVAVGAVLAIAAAVASLTMLHSTVYSSASTQMVVDSPRSALADAGTDLTPFTARAVVYARLMTSPQALEYIGQAAGVPGNLIAATGPVELNGPVAVHTPTAVQGGRLASPSSSYTLDFLQNPQLPTVDVYADAPTTGKAIALANGAVRGFAAYISNLEVQSGVPAGKRIEIRQLGGASGGVVDPAASKSIAGMIFIAVLAVWCGLVLLATNLRRQLRAARNPQADAHGGAVFQPVGAEYAARAAGHNFSLPHSTARRGADANPAPDPGDTVAESSFSGNHAGDRDEEDDVRRGLRLGH